MFQTPDLNSHPRLSSMESQSHAPGPLPKPAALRSEAAPFDVSLRKAMMGPPANSRARPSATSQAAGKPGKKTSSGAIPDAQPDASVRPTAPRKNAPPSHDVRAKAKGGATKVLSADLAAAQATASEGTV